MDMATVHSACSYSTFILCRLIALLTVPIFAVPATAQTWRIVPQASLRETYTDNADLAAAASAQSRMISDISTGVLLERIGPRLSFLFDYRLRSLVYAGESRLNSHQNFLNSRATFELVDNWLFIDARADISQQNQTAFGSPVAADSLGLNPNQAETKTYRISPYVRGIFADKALYQLRFNASESRAAESVIADTRSAEWLALVSSTPNSGRLGWLVDGNAQFVNSDETGKRKYNRGRISLIYQLLPTLALSAIAGYEVNDLVSSEMRSGSSNGFGLDWNPGPRTRLIATGQKRFFGDSYSFSFSHRTALTAWRLSSTRDVLLSPNNVDAASQISVAELVSDILASSIPDPAARSAAVSQRLGQSGPTTATTTSTGFLTARPTLNRRHDASMVIIGSRSTIALALSRRDLRALGSASVSGDSFDLSEDIRQTTLSASWLYRLTPLSSLSFSVSRSKSDGLRAASFESEQRLQSVYFTTSLGPQISAGFGVRRDQFDSTRVISYRENSVSGSLSLRF